MHCLSCDRLLSEAEDARTFQATGTRVGLCRRCIIWIPNDLLAGGVADEAFDDADDYPYHDDDAEEETDDSLESQED